MKILISGHTSGIGKGLADIFGSNNHDIYGIARKNNNELEYIPISTVVNPLGTVLYGPNPEPANNEKRFRLELFYTEINN